MICAARPILSSVNLSSKYRMKSATRALEGGTCRHSDILFRICAPFTWNHPKRALLGLDEEHGFRSIAIKLAMQPA